MLHSLSSAGTHPTAPTPAIISDKTSVFNVELGQDQTLIRFMECMPNRFLEPVLIKIPAPPEAKLTPFMYDACVLLDKELYADENLVMTVPEWYIDNGEGSNGQTSVVTDDNLGSEFQLHDQIAPLLPVNVASDGLGRSPSSHTWDPNFPGIC
ncbi:hypothetical protein V6N12_015249 [Hibiscus sabdariffa]|uniref:Uncharacterized protein n=1 Tax=Hibiscus sabdariffa TaxID=183260 RepID=A0ABR2DP68_9ROSI